MSKYKTYEYIWLDGAETQNLRSKTRVLTIRSEDDSSFKISLKDIPPWTFDGSSTAQSSTANSDLILRPVFVCNLSRSYLTM
mgnify:CR=1 FL=1